MPTLKLETSIQAPIELCFDLARSVEVHLESTAHTHEKVIGGRSSGLCELGDVITWRARHFGFFQNLTVEITHMNPYSHFQDKMVKGAFRQFTHEHYFRFEKGVTIMEDVFQYSAPLFIFGRAAENLFLNRYMYNLLERRNQTIKNLAEAFN